MTGCRSPRLGPAERGLDLPLEVLVPLPEGLLLLLDRLHADREGLPVLLELLLQDLAVVRLHEEDADGLVHGRVLRELPEFLERVLHLPEFRLELEPLRPEDLELLLELLVLLNLVLELRGDLLHGRASFTTPAATSAHRRYEFRAARSAPASSASIARVTVFPRPDTRTRVPGISRPASRDNAFRRIAAPSPSIVISARGFVT